jgi:hypothetical protein
MAVSTPDWLTQRGGELVASKDGQSWSVYFAGQLQYLLKPVPAKGTHSCRITQTINGRRLDGPATYPTEEAAVAGGLEQLRGALGW